MMKKWLVVGAFVLAVAALQEAFAATNPITFNLGGTNFLPPFQKVEAVQLYSVSAKQGYTGAQTVLAAWGSADKNGDRKAVLSFGAAPVIGTSQNVPFASLMFRLPARFFDLANNSLMFGAFAGKESNNPHATVGIAASVSLW